MEETEKQQIQQLVKEELNKRKEKSAWRKYKDGCYKLFPFVLAIVIIFTILEDGILESVMTLFGLGFGFAFWTLIVWIFKIRDSNPKVDSSRVAYKFICIVNVTVFIIAFIIGLIGE